MLSRISIRYNVEHECMSAEDRGNFLGKCDLTPDMTAVSGEGLREGEFALMR